ncbi:nucleotide-diphospho-sugar transferase [Suillus plorans]|uniref:Nucleotide-diphospho-sugar transferase n=1 Tax=Suillus plorans TaxID=116603 RepID=A0A9P7E3Z9_9AGAM|nr:nucleotide-diphospho-sugar transferase [Suillus plorans]KAG1810446.1 nucleotide-diphospho-sugar transferase [Suillus plorans]
MSSMKQLEDRFNRKFQYPYVFLNDEPFTQSFQDATVEFGLIPSDHWHQPSWIDEERASKSRDDMIRNDRFIPEYVSLQFWLLLSTRALAEVPILLESRARHPAFLRRGLRSLSHDARPKQGVRLYDKIPATIPTLWNILSLMLILTPGNAMEFLSDDGGESHSLRHFWSNFEIADLDFWRGEAYSKFSEYLDEQGGFYYEHWGDAPVHSIGAALFAKKEQIHFNDIGYQHEHFEHCPQGDVHTKGKCWCNLDKSVGKYLYANVELPLKLVSSDYQVYSCLYQHDKLLL